MTKSELPKIRYFYCYKITCNINGKGYIGIASNGVKARFNQHKHDAKRGADTPLHAAIRKYGAENFTIEIIEKMTNWDEICRIEREMIIKHNTRTQNGSGYNIASGGEGPFGVIRSSKTRQKLSQITKKWLAEDHRRIDNLREVGKKQASVPGQKELSIEGAKKAWQKPGYREEVSARVKKWAKENKDLMSKNQREVMTRPGFRDNLIKKAKKQMKDPKNREASKEGALKQWSDQNFKEKMTHQMKGVSKRNWESPQYRERMKQISCKPIIANGQYYPSLEDAAKALYVKANTICTRLKNPNFPDYYYLPSKRQLLIEGIRYPSVNAAAKSLEISNAVCKRRIESEDFPEYIIIEQQDDTIGTGEK